jgi:site-specific recombinase XerC
MEIRRELEFFLRHLKSDRGLSPRTVGNYTGLLNRLLGYTPDLEPEACLRFVREAADGTPRAPATQNWSLTVIRAFSRYLVDKGALRMDPTEGAKRVPVPRPSRRALTAADVGSLVEELQRRRSSWHQARDEAMIATMFYSGLRVSELVSIDVGQVVLRQRVLLSVKRKGGGRTDVHLHEVAVIALRNWLRTRGRLESPAVFIGRATRARLSTRAVQKLLRKLGAAAGLDAHPHALRHAHATALLRAGTPTAVIKDSLNHKSVKTTERYLHGDDAMVRAAISQLPAVPGLAIQDFEPWESETTPPGVDGSDQSP